MRAGSFFGAGAMIEVASHDCNAIESSSSVGSTIVFTIEPVAACISTIPIAFFVGSIVIPNVSSPAHTSLAQLGVVLADAAGEDERVAPCR